MADNKQELEVSLKFGATGVDEVIRDAERVRQSVSTGAANPAAAASAAGFSSFDAPMAGSVAPLPPPPQPTTDPGIPVGSLGDYQQRVQAVQAIAPNAPDVANMAASRLQTSILNAAVQDPDSARDYQDLINSLKELRQSIQDDGKKKDGIGDLMGWMKAQALLQTTQHIGTSVANNAMQGNFLSAGGGAVGALVGGGLGLLGGPAGMVAGMGMGASIGGAVGGFAERLLGGAGDALKYETQIADINQRFGLGSVGRLRNYDQGGSLGFTAEQSAGIVDQLRENRALSNPAMAGPLVNVIQEMTRALGLNVEATTNMAGIYSRTGGEKGAEGVRGYLSDVVGGAIRAGFESNIQQYADMMGSARMMSTQQTGQAVSDRAFGMLQDVMAGLTGGDSRTSNLFRDNMQMAAGGLQTFMSFGGTNNPFGTSAAFMRLAGINESSLDSRFSSPEQIAQNAQLGLRFTTDRLRQNAGMNAEEFSAAAAGDPNFVQNLLRGNAGLQRQTTQMVSGFIGREASAQDLRAYEEMANIMAANGGRMPTGNNDGARRVQQLMGQLQESPGDRARNLEAQAHNETIKAMSNFMDAANKLKEWQVDALKWINTLDLKKVGDGIEDAMDKLRTWATNAGVHIRNAGAAMIEAAHKVRDAAKDMAEMIKEFRESAIGKMLLGGGFNPGEVGEQIGSTLSSPAGRNLGLTYMAAMPGPLGGLANAANIVRAVQSNPEAISVENAQRAAGTVYRYGPYGPEARRRAPGFLRGAADYLGGMIDGIFNDTPGSVTAGPGYNVFAFAPGDVVSARMGGTSGGATLTDLHQVLTEANVMAVQYEQNQSARSKVLQDSTNNILATDLLIQTNSDINTQKQFPTLIELNQFLAKAATVRDGLLAKIEAHFPNLIAAVHSLGQAMANLGGMGANAMAGSAGAFASGLFTGPRANIGGSSPNHIDTKFRTSVSWEEIDKYFMQMAQAYAEQGRRIEFSNDAVAGQVFDPNMPQDERIAMLRRAAAAHAPRPGWHSFDYYIPKTGDARSEDPNSSSAGAEIMLPVVPGGRVAYATDPATVGGYGNFATLYDAAGNRIMTTGHGDNRRPLPQARTFPNQPIASGGGSAPGRGVDLRSGYESLEQLSQQLTGLDPRFNTNTPEGRAAMAMALAIGGTEHFGYGQTATNFFTLRGGTGNNMLGFAQYNQTYHAAQTQTPQSYTRYLADMLTGARRLPDNTRAGNLSAELAQAVQSGEVSSGADLQRWMQQNRLGAGSGHSNWQAIRDGWGRTPGLADDLVRMMRGGGPQASAARTNNITINIASDRNPNEIARAVVNEARPYLDEMEVARATNRNPRNSQSLSPVYG